MSIARNSKHGRNTHAHDTIVACRSDKREEGAPIEIHKRNNSTHQVLPSSDSFAELLENVRRTRQSEIRVLADDEVPEATHVRETVAETDNSGVDSRWPLRAQVRHLKVRGTVVDGHVEFLQGGTVLDDIEQP